MIFVSPYYFGTLLDEVQALFWRRIPINLCLCSRYLGLNVSAYSQLILEVKILGFGAHRSLSIVDAHAEELVVLRL